MRSADVQGSSVPRVLLSGLGFGESPRWHDGRLWLCNWGTREIIAVDASGEAAVMVRLPFDAIPFSIDWRGDGRLLIVSSGPQPVLCQQADGALAPCADVRRELNEVVVDGRGNTYVNGAGFNPLSGEKPAPGVVLLITTDGKGHPVAEGIAFPNGMAISPDGGTLVVADSYRRELVAFTIAGDGSLSDRRTWAALGEDPPDGICFDSEGAIWYAAVPTRRCVRVREGGERLQSIELDRGCFACMLGGRGGTTLYITAAQWPGMDKMIGAPRTGQLVSVEVTVPHAGWP